MKNSNLKELYRKRIQQIIISTVAWSMLLPFMQVAYHYLTPELLGLLSMLVTLAGSFQKFFGKFFTLRGLFKALFVLDLMMIIINPMLVNYNIKYWVIFDMIATAPYALIVGLLVSKLGSITIKRYKAYAFTNISNRTMELRFRSNLLGITIGTIFAYMDVSLFHTVLVQDVFLTLLLFVSIKAYRELPR